MSNRVDWVDYAKAIGIILVVYGHVARGAFAAGIDMSEVHYELVDSIIYSFHMPLFFFLSGLFFYGSFQKKGGKSLVFSKIDTIFYPCVLWSLLQGGIEVGLSNYTNGNVSVSEVLALLWAPRAQFWFLYALFFIFVFAVAVYAILPAKSSIPIFLVAILIYLFPQGLVDWKIINLIVANFVFFSFGIVFSLFGNIEKLSKLTSVLILLILFVLGQWLYHRYFSWGEKGWMSLVLAFVSILFVVSFSGFASKKPHKVISYIGVSSMAIYLVHVLAGSGVRVVLKEFMGVESVVVHLVLGTLIGTLLPMLVMLLVDRFRIRFLFSAPICLWGGGLYSKIFSRRGNAI